MDDEELPSESTSRPIFRSKVNKTISSKTKKKSNSRKKKKIQSTSTSRSKTSKQAINIHVEENLIHVSDCIASDETDNDEPNPQSSVVTKKTSKTKLDVWKYFTILPNGDYKCNLCPDSAKTFPKSNESFDTNLRSHLGRTHKLTDFLYPSQLPTKKLPKEESIPDQRKKDLDTAAIQAIIEDSHSFNIFRKPGMQKFLSKAVPGYRGPNRRTVVKRLKSMYKERRSTIRNNLSSVSDISLSADIWKSIRRDHFLCLSAHYYDEHYQFKSNVIAFRRFLGPHYSDRIEQFITHEVEKLNIETKIRSLTTDNGSDIRLASQNKFKFGTRISCLTHVLNLVVQNGLWLFKIPIKPNVTPPLTTNTTASTITVTKSKNTKSNNTKLNNIKSNNTTSNSTSSKTTTTKLNTVSSSFGKIKSNLILSASSTTKSNKTTVPSMDSSTEDDDYDFNIDDDAVWDQVSDDDNKNYIINEGGDVDNKNYIINESSDVDNSSDNISTTSSLSDGVSNWSSSENDDYYDDLNTPLSSTIIQEEFINTSYAQPSILLSHVHMLLQRVRKLVTMIRNISALNRYVVKQIKLFLENLNRQRAAENKKKIRYKEFTLDMKIRWNSSFVMISRFVFFNSIITSLTYNPSEQINLKQSQYRKLKKLSFTSLDWSILKVLENILAPFNNSTTVLSCRRRPTLSICKPVIRGLINFLKVADDAPHTLENLLKKQLLLNLNFYLNKHITDEQNKAMLISSFLDPATCPYISCDDQKEAETIISNEAQQHYTKLNSQLLSSSSQSSITTSSNKDKQNNEANILKNFFISCGIELHTASSDFKLSTIKEELAQYIAPQKRFQTCSEYWNANKDRLPVLSSFVRQYNIMCATSIDCESAFSIARFIHRKSRSALAPSSLRYSMVLREQIKNKQM
ncbi:unnamed protein product [Rotaria sp. Silwood1]|nr:unnamed protein product [Rotaria sp. Silwood1]CAF1631945.1 unnamed protein product [Rotaria sp. Silwood1]CAF3709604.1 unnamed protein product [Rotaria sp. Silwood1]CAF3781487.1 unnamed protein product [Rotaria sp. Silwood1]CAF4718317.1 unnamed protein product [Rotaria sp. Silwood1]